MAARHDPDDVPAIARYQRGVFTRAQAQADNFTRRQVDQRIASGSWRKTHGKGLVRASTVPEPRSAAVAAWLTRPGVVVMGPAAAAWHGAPVPVASVVDILTAKTGDDIFGRIRPHRLRVEPHEVEKVTTINGLDALTTHRDRAFVEALAWLPYRDALALAAWLASRELYSHSNINAYLAEHPGTVGNGQLRRLLVATAGGAFSPAERRAHELLHAAGITGWEADVPFRDARGIIGRADIYFHAQRLVVEIDGRDAHAQRAMADNLRDNRTLASGRRVVRIPAAILWSDPAGFVRTIIAILTTT